MVFIKKARTAVIAGTATAVSGGVVRRQQARAEEAAEARPGRSSRPAAWPAAVRSGLEGLDQLLLPVLGQVGLDDLPLADGYTKCRGGRHHSESQMTT